MTLILGWLGGGYDIPGLEPEIRWAWLTITLSVLVVVGYVAIAMTWYLQSRLTQAPDATTPLARLGAIVLGCGVCGCWFSVSRMSWPAWRLYDGMLLALAVYACWFALRMRGLRPVRERLARVDALEHSVQKYYGIAELLPHMVWTATAEGRVDFCNRRWAEYAAGGRTWLESVHPDGRQLVLARWREALRTRQPMTVETRLRGRAGYRTFVVSAAPVTQGDVVRWLGACADVENQNLRVAEKDAQARQQAFLLNALSHDLRAPLHNVAMNAHLLKMTASEPDQVESADVIVENAVAAGELVTKLLEVAKAGGHDSTVIAPISAGEVLGRVARRFLPVAQRKGLYLRVSTADGDVCLATDRQKLQRIVGNLLDNAIKYTHRGGVTLELLRTGQGARIRVSDTGRGVPPDSVGCLFDEFYQVDNEGNDPKKGFGMGLAICRDLARQLGGDVRLAGTGPNGSCFEVTIGAGRAARGARDDRRAARRNSTEGVEFAGPEAGGVAGVFSRS
jgi:signal transduction histidine kinase